MGIEPNAPTFTGSYARPLHHGHHPANRLGTARQSVNERHVPHGDRLRLGVHQQISAEGARVELARHARARPASNRFPSPFGLPSREGSSDQKVSPSSPTNTPTRNRTRNSSLEARHDDPFHHRGSGRRGSRTHVSALRERQRRHWTTSACDGTRRARTVTCPGKSVRTARFEPAISWSPTRRDNQTSPRSEKVGFSASPIPT